MDPDQTARMRRMVWIHAGRKLTMLVLSLRGSIVLYIFETTDDSLDINPINLVMSDPLTSNAFINNLFLVHKVKNVRITNGNHLRVQYTLYIFFRSFFFLNLLGSCHLSYPVQKF
jgi:hypothetical protein